MTTATQTAPEIVRFGPFRTIGISYLAGNGNFDFPGLWDRFMKRIGEISMPANARCFGFCRCIPGKTDGTWDYVAAVEATDASKIPEGMIEVDVPQCEYASIAVDGLENIKRAWSSVQKGAAAVPGYTAYCGAKGCECATHPAFEYYPPEFPKNARLYVYVPLKRA